jgi:predicted TIM-barrel fold metal-dependent hydrolase
MGESGTSVARVVREPKAAPAAAQPQVDGAVAILDVHTHIFPDRVAPTALGTIEEMAGVRPSFDGTCAGLLAALDRAGVSRAAVQPVATRPGQVAGINDWVAALPRERLIPFGAFHPDLAEPAAELARIAALGLPGFKLHPEFQLFAPDERRMDDVYEAAAGLGLAIFFHAGRDIAVPTYRGTPESFARVHRRHPGLTLILAHMGGWGVWDEVREHLLGRDVYLETSMTLHFLGDEGFVELVRAHGVERVLFGSDAPWDEVRGALSRVRAAGLDDEELEAVLARNALRLLPGMS